MAAYLILQEAPTMPQYIGGSFILVGIFLNQIGVMRQSKELVKLPVSNVAKEMDMEVGFKGV